MKTKIIKYIRMWEERCYFNGIPDEAPKELEVRGLVPSYKRIAIAILKNDVSLKSLGFTPKTSKFYKIYKTEELKSKQRTKQLKLEL